MNPTNIEVIGTVLFGLAVLHTFSVKKFNHLAAKYESGSVGENFFHFLGEVEVVFGLWSAVFIGFYSFENGFLFMNEAHELIFGAGGGYRSDDGGFIKGAINYLSALNYTEPVFVFVIMTMAATRPVILLVEKIILYFSSLIPCKKHMAFYISTLIFGPLLGSFITEPAAMTVTALILLRYFYANPMSRKFMYATIGVLFVNISIGGTLTHFAAPPVLMVASKWGWGISHMFGYFGYKAAIACVVNTLATAYVFRKEFLDEFSATRADDGKKVCPPWLTIAHLLFLAMVVYTAHFMVFFLGLFLFFLGFVAVTTEYQDELKLKESLLVGFFLGGLVTLGAVQAWWLQEVLASLSDFALFAGATSLTAITDNAALTYLGSLVEMTDSAKFNLVAGAVAGGGLTVIANAPNPAGFGILKEAFGEDGINPLKLLMGALLPTLVGCLFLQLLPSITF